jgi:Leucine-rich repeat (LRR) protein
MGEAPGPEPDQISELQRAMVSQGRIADAGSLLERLGMKGPAAIKALREAIENDPELEPLREMITRREFRGRFTPQADGGYSANLRGLPYFSLVGFFKAAPTQITGLVLDEVNLPDLTVLQGMNLHALSLAGCKTVKNLAPLREQIGLQRLNLSRTGVTDLKPLIDLPLLELNLEDCNKLTDLRPLAQCENLERLVLPKGPRDISFLRQHKSLQFLGYRSGHQPVADFWREFDARK